MSICFVILKTLKRFAKNATMPLIPGEFENLPRNEVIYLMWKWGMMLTEIGEYFGLSKQRIYAIVQKYNKKQMKGDQN